MDHNDDNQGHQHNGQSNQRYQDNGTSTGWEFALDNPLLSMEVTLEPKQQDQNADTQETRAKRLSQSAQRAV